MYLNGYIREFGKYSFEEHPFNDVDALVFAELSYLNLDLVLNKEIDGSILLKNIDLSNIDDLVKQQSDTKKNKVMLPLMMKSKRYKDIVVKDVAFKNDNHDVCQFYAMTIFFENKMYISYRGTDLTLRGWKEDLDMAYNKLVPGHVEALRYINKIINKYDNHYYVGGHSKGGNLAVYAAYFKKIEEDNRLIKVYSFDGPGFFDENLTEEITNSELAKKIIKYVPRESVVGIVLKHTKIAKIVDAQSVGVFQHDPFNWKINDKGHFVILPRRSVISLISEKSLNNWLDSLSRIDMSLLSELIFNSFTNLSIDLIEVKNNFWKYFRQIQDYYKKMNKKDQKRLKDIGVKLIKSNAKSTVDVIKENAKNNFKKNKNNKKNNLKK